MIKRHDDVIDDSPEECNIDYESEYHRLLEENKLLKDENIYLKGENKYIRGTVDKLRFGMRVVEAILDKNILDYLYDT